MSTIKSSNHAILNKLYNWMFGLNIGYVSREQACLLTAAAADADAAAAAAAVASAAAMTS